MKIRSFFALIFTLLFLSFGWADTISKDIIFSNSVYVGGIECGHDIPGSYCELPTPVFKADGTALNKKENIQGACIKGGGDCQTVAFLTETKNLNTEFLLTRVSTKSGQQEWIKVKKTNLKKIDELMPKLGIGENEIEFRPGLQFVFADKELSRKIPLTKIPNISLKPQSESDKEIELLEYEELPSTLLRGKKIIGIRINKLKVDAEKYEDDPGETKKKAVRTKVQDFYFPAFDEKGRINYWPVPDPGC